MPLFLSNNDVFRLLQRELPPSVYPDGAEGAFYSTAENAAVADAVATAYANLQRIYANFWPQQAVEHINDWAITAFGYQLDASIPLALQQNLIQQKYTAKKGTTTADLLEIVASIIGTDVYVEIVGWGSQYGSWIIGENQLGVTTIFSSGGRLKATGPNLCSAQPSDFGLTQDQWNMIRENAYTYSVLIYGFTPTADQLTQLNEQLSIYELARDQHVIFYGLDQSRAIFYQIPVMDGGAPGSTYTTGIDGGSPSTTGLGGIDGGAP